MTDQEAKDRLEINELLARYSWAMADRDWDTWQSVFAPDATVDYGTAGGPVGTPAEAAEAFAAMFVMFDVAMSQVTNVMISFESADRATSRSMYRMLMRVPGSGEGATPSFMEAQGDYDDTLVRTDAGWKILRRFERLAYIRA